MAQTYWNFLPEHAVRGTGVVSSGQSYGFVEKGLVGARIPVVWLPRLDLYLDNRKDEGWWAVTEGFGSPSVKKTAIEIVPDTMLYD